MFKAIQKLQALLSDKNLEYLDVILGNLIDAKNPSFPVFWRSFKTAFPGRSEVAYKEAYAGIRQLKTILSEYRTRAKG